MQSCSRFWTPRKWKLLTVVLFLRHTLQDAVLNFCLYSHFGFPGNQTDQLKNETKKDSISLCISYLIFWPREHHSINCLIQQDEPTARGINLNKLPHYIHEITEDEASGNQLTIAKTICPHYYLLYGRKSRLIILKACLSLFEIT